MKVIKKDNIIKEKEFKGKIVKKGIVGFLEKMKEMIGKKEKRERKKMEKRVIENMSKRMKIKRDEKKLIYQIQVKKREEKKQE